MTIIIKGERINLRILKKSDANAIYEGVSNPEVSRYIPLIPKPYKLEDANWFISHTKKSYRKKSSYELAIELKKEKKIVGMIGLTNLNQESKRAEIGYWLNQNYWRQGIISEALELLVDYGFTQLELEKITAKVLHENEGSAKLLTKHGFTLEGRLRRETYTNDQWYDDLVYSILKEEYQTLKRKE